jgi:hypothetical protein
MAVTQRKQIWRSAPEFDLPEVRGMPSAESDFLPELHRSRSAQGMTRFFGEAMRDKKSNTADAKQKRN